MIPLMSKFEIETPFIWLALACLVALLLLYRWRRRSGRDEPVVAFSNLHLLVSKRRSWRLLLAPLPTGLKLLSLTALLLALANPRLLVEEPVEQEVASGSESEEPEELLLPREGIALYFVLDRSGSMAEETEVALHGGKQRKRMQRIEMLKWLTQRFIQGDPELALAGRYSDMIGLVGFARVAQVLSPLTLNHRSVLDELQKLSVVRFQQENGTAIGYALFKTVNLIAATRHFQEQLARPTPYTLKSSVIVMITDGLPSPHPLDARHPLRSMELSQAARYALNNEVRLYLINVEPKIRHPHFKQFFEDQKLAAELTGGKFFVADHPKAMEEIYTEIDRLERSQLPQPLRIHATVEEVAGGGMGKTLLHKEWAPYLIAAALLLLGIAITLESTVLRRVP